MASLMEELILILEEETVEYKSLLELSKEKTQVIVSGSIEELTKITDKEQLVVSSINKLEKKREETLKDISVVLNKDIDILKVTNIIKMLEKRPMEQKRLAKAHDSLKETVDAMVNINNQNRMLIEHALEMVEFDMNLVKSMRQAPEVANYNKGAYNVDSYGNSRGRFDAKQ